MVVREKPLRIIGRTALRARRRGGVFPFLILCAPLGTRARRSPAGRVRRMKICYMKIFYCPLPTSLKIQPRSVVFDWRTLATALPSVPLSLWLPSRQARPAHSLSSQPLPSISSPLSPLVSSPSLARDAHCDHPEIGILGRDSILRSESSMSVPPHYHHGAREAIFTMNHPAVARPKCSLWNRDANAPICC